MAHFSHGFVAGIVAIFWSLWLAVFLYVQFLLYEAVEETKVRDEMYLELKEWATGFILGVGFAFLVTVLLP